MEINWHPPPPRSGWNGVLDRVIGPGATRAELWLQGAGAVVLAAAVLTLTLSLTNMPLTALQLGVLALLAFDLSGGVITNATAAAKRWYHRPGQGWPQQLAFVLPHGLHLVALVGVFPDLGWLFALFSYAYLIGATLTILAVPLYLQRPVALIAYVGAVLLNSVLAPPLALAWVLPVYFLKLLVAHLLKEAPYAQEPGGSRWERHVSTT
jgi:hypothetical protein